MSADALPDGPVPKHVQLREILRSVALQDGLAHTPIGSERELMARHEVSRATVREAIGQLVSEGLLYRVHGKGTFVAGERVESQLHLASFTDDMRRRGLEPKTRVLDVKLRTPPAREAAALRLEAGAKAWRLERLRIAGGDVMALELGWFPEKLLPALDEHDLSESLYTLFSEVYGLGVDSAQQTVWAESADDRRIKLMGLPAGIPLLAFRRTSSAGQLVVEHTLSWYRGDRYQVNMSLDRRMSPGQLPTQGGRS
ncbi:MAG: GntR family transcriptional regulator [Actinomycetota bacterium]|nr:GntR family transcriptional regulator [Actinomycetota bacterium]